MSTTNKAFIILACISLLSNPVYNIDSAAVTYSMTISVTGDPLSLSYTIYSDIDISEGGAAIVIADTGDIPLEWTDEITEETRPVFILTTAEIAAKTCVIDGITMTMTEGRETGLNAFNGANYLISYNMPTGQTGYIKWSKATGIMLSAHTEEILEDGIVNIDIMYLSSDVDIYSDQNAFIRFLLSPAGIALMIGIGVVVAALIVYAATREKQKGVRSRVLPKFGRKI